MTDKEERALTRLDAERRRAERDALRTERIRKYLADGLTLGEIAAATGINRKAIDRLMSAAGMSVPRGKASQLAEGLPG